MRRSGVGKTHQNALERAVELEQQVTALRSLTKELHRSSQQECQELAAVLQDQVQQLLVGARMLADRLSSSIQAAGDKELACQLDDLLGQSIKEVRSLTARLGMPAHDEQTAAPVKRVVV